MTDLRAAAMARFGSVAAFAAHIGVSRQLAYRWIATEVPAKWCHKVSVALGVELFDLRPDLWETPMNRNGMMDHEVTQELDDACLTARERGEKRDFDRLLTAAEHCVEMLRQQKRRRGRK